MDTDILRRILLSKGLRAFGDGFVSLLLPLYLLELGHGPLEVGVLATATLLGSGLLSLAIGARAHRHSFRALLIAASLLMAATGAAFAGVTAFWPLLLVAFVGTLNPSGGDVSVFLPIEHALMSGAVADDRRTAAFAWYSLAGALAGAAGAWGAGAIDAIAGGLALSRAEACRAMFLAYGAIGLATAAVYRGLPAGHHAKAAAPRAPLGPSKGRVVLLASLFSVDAFGGGLVVQSLMALWLFQRFDLSPADAGALFFGTGVLSAISFLAAVRIAKRIGLVNTMVFTHIPANACLVMIPFMSSLAPVVVLLLVRAALSQMDVPTRSSYVMAIVTPAERPAAASLTAVPRSLASAASPFLAGWMLTVSPFGWPLVAAGVLKIAYDLALLACFGRIRPPEEARAQPTRSPAR